MLRYALRCDAPCLAAVLIDEIKPLVRSSFSGDTYPV
jgi:hypothetical protein